LIRKIKIEFFDLVGIEIQARFGVDDGAIQIRYLKRPGI
jgi:hypothetical protein